MINDVSVLFRSFTSDKNMNFYLVLFICFIAQRSFEVNAFVRHQASFSKVFLGRLQMGALNSSPMELCQENAELVIDEVRKELGTIFGYDEGSRSAGITGKIDLVEVDGPTIVIKLSGRFWHATDTVMMRVESFIKQRIPEVIEVVLDTKSSQIVDDNRLNTEGSKTKKLF